MHPISAYILPANLNLMWSSVGDWNTWTLQLLRYTLALLNNSMREPKHHYSTTHLSTSCWSTLYLHGVCMLCECAYGECAHKQHVRRTLTLTLTHTITAVLSKWKCRTCAHTQLCN